jgi:hypothetical protein
LADELESHERYCTPQSQTNAYLGTSAYVTHAGNVLSWTVMVIPTCAALRYGWGLYCAWAFASAYVVAFGLAMLARFKQG